MVAKFYQNLNVLAKMFRKLHDKISMAAVWQFCSMKDRCEVNSFHQKQCIYKLNTQYVYKHWEEHKLM